MDDLKKHSLQQFDYQLYALGECVQSPLELPDDTHWCQLKKKARIFKKEERRLQREKKAKIG